MGEEPKQGWKRKFEGYRPKAEEYLKDPQKAGDLGRRAAQMADRHRGPLEKVWDDVQTLFRLIQAWAQRRYTAIPAQSIVLIIGAVIYFVSPIDAIPDLIPVLGLVDDAAILSWVIASIHSDIEKFRLWEQSQQTA